MFPIKTVQDYMYPEKLRGELAEQAERARLYGEQAQWYGPKSQADINLINQGQIPHYQALNDLIHQGQIPHYLSQARLIDQGQIPHFQTQNRFLGEQTQEIEFENKLKSAKWKEWKRLQDEIDAINSNSRQGEQQAQYNYPINTPSLSKEDKARIENNFNRSYTGAKGQINPSEFQSLSSALGMQRRQPNIVPQQQNNSYSFTPMPQNLNEANQLPVMQQQQIQQPSQLNQTDRIKQLRQAQQEIFGKFGTASIKAGTETPEEKRQGQISVAQEKENIKEAAKDTEKAELASEAAKVAEGALNKMLESSRKMTMLQSGGLFGHAPGFADARQEFDQESAMLQKSVMDSMKGQGQMSQAKMRFIESLKPNSKMNEKVRESTALTLLSAAKRSGERITFNASASDAGFDPKQTKVLWKLYNDERPEYDSKKQIPINDNLNTFSDYMNKDALDAAIHGKHYSPKKQGEESNMVIIQLPTGQKGNIPKEKLDEALKRGARIIQ